MLGIQLQIDKRSVDNAKKKIEKPVKSESPETAAPTKQGFGGLGSMLSKAIPIAALISLIKPIRQTLEVIGAILSIGLKPLLPLLRIFLLAGVWIFKKLDKFLKGLFSETKENAPQLSLKETDSELSSVIKKIINGLLMIGTFFFNLGKKIGDWLLNGIIRPISDFILNVINQASTFILGVIKSISEFITEAVTETFGLIKEGLLTVWRGLKFSWEIISRGLRWVWEGLIKPVWTWLKGKFESIWNVIIKPVWDWIKDKFNSINNFLIKIVNKIKSVWDKIRNFKLPSFGGGRETKVNDALITDSGRVIKFNPNDNILAFQGNLPSGNTTINIKVDGFVGDEDLLAEKITKAISNRNRGGLSNF